MTSFKTNHLTILFICLKDVAYHFPCRTIHYKNPLLSGKVNRQHKLPYTGTAGLVTVYWHCWVRRECSFNSLSKRSCSSKTCARIAFSCWLVRGASLTLSGVLAAVLLVTGVPIVKLPPAGAWERGVVGRGEAARGTEGVVAEN